MSLLRAIVGVKRTLDLKTAIKYKHGTQTAQKVLPAVLSNTI